LSQECKASEEGKYFSGQWMSSKRMQGNSRGSEHFQEFIKVTNNILIIEYLKVSSEPNKHSV
jgi:hypothetical protein